MKLYYLDCFVPRKDAKREWGRSPVMCAASLLPRFAPRRFASLTRFASSNLRFARRHDGHHPHPTIISCSAPTVATLAFFEGLFVASAFFRNFVFRIDNA